MAGNNNGVTRATRRSLAPVGLEMLAVLARHPEGLGISELARSVDLEVAQAHRTVRELVASGWIAQPSPNSSYCLTGALLALAAEQLRRSDIRTVAVPLMRRLKQQIGETIVLAEFRAGQLVCVARELSEAPVVTWTQIGDSWPLGSPAAVSIAVEAAIEGTQQPELMPPEYEPTAERIDELNACLLRGWSYDAARYRPGGCAAGAAILDFEGRPLGALAIGWPKERSDPDRIEEFGRLVRDTAAEVSGKLGFRHGDLAAPWRTIAEDREVDLFRHLADLRGMSYEGAVGREEQQGRFRRACELLSPVVHEVMTAISDRLLDGQGRVTESESDTPADGAAVVWSLRWPEQEAAITRASGAPLAPVSVVGRLRPSHIHGHLGSSYLGDWPMQIVTPADARRQSSVVLAIVEAEMHQRIFEGGGNWRLIPAFCRQVGEPSLIGSAPRSGGGA